MNAAPLFPFYDLFCAVRAHLGLTISDYTALLEALEYSLKACSGIHLINELVTVCQLLWAKTPEACDEIDIVVRRYAFHAVQEYQKHLSARTGEQADPIQSRQDLETLVAEWARRDEPPPKSALVPDEPPVSQGKAETAPLSEVAPPTKSEAPTPAKNAAPTNIEIVNLDIPSPQTYQNMVAVTLQPELSGYVVTEIMEQQTGAQVYIPPAEKYRVPPRRMRHLWRLYRLPQRSGANLVFSLPDTIASIERHGGLPVPIYKPRMTNQARVLLLIDVSRYMDGYQRDVEVLVNAFVSSAFHRRHILYFEGTPERDTFSSTGDELAGWEVYADTALEKPVQLSELRAALDRAGVLIVSDAAAAGNRHQMRYYLETMADFVAALKFIGSRVVWLNPARSEKWPNTAAEMLQANFHMHPYSPRGLESAVNELRGFVSA
jgi:hypothetical protein